MKWRRCWRSRAVRMAPPMSAAPVVVVVADCKERSNSAAATTTTTTTTKSKHQESFPSHGACTTRKLQHEEKLGNMDKDTPRKTKSTTTSTIATLSTTTTAASEGIPENTQSRQTCSIERGPPDGCQGRRGRRTSALHKLCQEGTHNDNVKALLAADPLSVQMPNEEGRLPLHLACVQRRTSLELFKELVEACPQAASVADQNGMLPLHCLCSSTTTTTTTFTKRRRMGMSTNTTSDPPPPPQQQQQQDNAANNNVVRAKVQLLLLAYPYALYARDLQGRFPIHCACAAAAAAAAAAASSSSSDASGEQEAALILVAEMLRRDSSIASIPSRGGHDPFRSSLPLLMVVKSCDGGASSSSTTRLMEHLLKAFPAAAGIPHATTKCLPLCHVTFHYRRRHHHHRTAPTTRTRRRRIKEEAFSSNGCDAAQLQLQQQQDWSDKTRAPSKNEQWHLLVDAYPAALFRQCPTCQTSPLDKNGGSGDSGVVATRQERQEFIRTSLSPHHHHLPVRFQEDMGGTLLHAACGRFRPRLSLWELERLVALDPSALSSATECYGQLPLHVLAAAGNNAMGMRDDDEGLAIWRYLVEMYPKALSTANVMGQLPLHVALANEAGISMAVLRFLVEMYPSALSTTNVLGQLPLHVVLSSSSSLSLSSSEPSLSNRFMTSTVRYLVDMNPSALSVADIFGYLPLHWAVSQGSNHENENVVELLLQGYGSALHMPTPQGYLPLLLAGGCQNPKSRQQQASVNLLYTLLRHNPAALLMQQQTATTTRSSGIREAAAGDGGGDADLVGPETSS